MGLSVAERAGALAEIERWVQRETGLAIGPWAEAFAWRMARIQARHGHESPEDLLAALEARASEQLCADVIDAAATQETSWFRDAVTFDALRAIVLARGRPVSVWSAGCAFGQEIYSVAMVLAEANVLAGSRLLATDISPNAVRRARQGRYLGFEMARGLTSRRRETYFRRDGPHWVLSGRIRRAVEFRVHDLREGSGEAFDFILCRHVLLYFDAPTQRQTLERLARSIQPGGYLVLGGAESIRSLDAPLQKSTLAGAAFYCPLPSRYE